MSEPITRLNQALEGRYSIDRELGEGGMATVYLAEDLKHERKVALKVLKPELAAVVGADRFLAEIKTTANLQHPHVLPLFDSGEADGFLFYVMPYVAGESLRQRLDREGQLSVEEGVRIVRQLATAMDHAHAQGVIHRDLKPANILFQADQPLIADFGIALAAGLAGGGRLTETGLSLGTPFYMSPEQATGEMNVDARSDVYALGCILFETLVGEPPHRGPTAQAVLASIIAGNPASPSKHRSSIPPNVDAAIRKALESLPADRFASADDFATALNDIAFRHRESPVDFAETRPGGSRPLTAGLATLSLALAIALGVSLSRSNPTPAVERFESPFREGQEPITWAAGSFALARDGSLLVYRGPGEDQVGAQLWVRRWQDLEARPIPNSQGAGAMAIAPDGRQVAFYRRDTIRLQPIDGGQMRNVATGVRPFWDEQGVLYATQDTVLVRVPLGGGVAEPIAQVGPGAVVVGLLPGGDFALVEVGREDGGLETQALSLRTNETQSLIAGSSAVYVDTGHLLFMNDGTLWATGLDLRSMEVGPQEQLIQAVQGYAVAQDGRLLYATGNREASRPRELVWVTREGNISLAETEFWFDLGNQAWMGWSLSPDGSRIAYRHLDDLGFDIWVKELNGGPNTRLAGFPRSVEGHPRWADNDTITFISDSLGNMDVWARAADGTGAAILQYDHTTALAQGFRTPDGTRLLLRPGAVTGVRGNRGIFLASVGDPTWTPLLASSEYDHTMPAVSPDGRWIAYSSTENGVEDVFVRPFPEVGASREPVSSEGGVMPRWAHERPELYYVNGRGEMVAATYTLEPGFRVIRQETLFTVPSDVELSIYEPTYEVAPDDERFLLLREYRGPEALVPGRAVVLVLNFLTELEARMGGG